MTESRRIQAGNRWANALKLKFAVILLASIALSAWPAASPAAAQAQAPDAAAVAEPDYAAIDSYVAGELARLHLPGAALVVVQGEHTVHLRGFGVADPSGRPVSAQTPFLLGSSTKSFTALAVMQLVEAGQLDLDAPVQRYLPWFRVADPAASAAITVRQRGESPASRCRMPRPSPPPCTWC